jgi:hypothetical protein
MKFTLACFAIFALLVVAVPAGSLPDDQQKVVDHLRDISVTVRAGGASGSGVQVVRYIGKRQVEFIWTAGHMLSDAPGPDGYPDAIVEKQVFGPNGATASRATFPAKVIAYSDPRSGHDIAVLMLREHTRAALFTRSATFDASTDPLRIGTRVLHVGSFFGQWKVSYSSGEISYADREISGKSYLQLTATAVPGSSGGGIFLPDSRYVGNLVLGAADTISFAVPVARMRKWAEETGILWAMDANHPMPDIFDLMNTVPKPPATNVRVIEYLIPIPVQPGATSPKRPGYAEPLTRSMFHTLIHPITDAVR